MSRSNRSRRAPGRNDRGGNGAGKVVGHGVPAKNPPPLRPGQVRCPVCRNGVSPTSAGRLRSHVDLFGLLCTNRSTGEEIHLSEIPDVILPPAPAPDPEPAAPRARAPRPVREPSRLDAGSYCQSCGKWIPGERRLCGRCFATGGRTR